MDLFQWMKCGPLLLLDSDEPVLAFEGLRLGHTCVKHKPPHPEFSKELETRVWDGKNFKREVRWGGTQKLDGFFAGFRKDVGKRAFNTAGPASGSEERIEQMANRMEHLIHCQVRLYQFKYWFGGHDLFAVFGKLREVERDSPGSLSWKSLEAFKIASRTVVQPQELLEEAVAQPEEPLEEEDLLEVLVGDDTASELFEDD